MFLCERIPNPVNLISQYTHHIKTARHVLAVMSAVQIELRRIAYPLLLTMANRLCRHTIACCFPVFYLDKYQILSVHSDQVDLTLAAAKIPLQNFHTPVGQKVCRQLLVPGYCLPFIFFVFHSHLCLLTTLFSRNLLCSFSASILLLHKILNEASSMDRGWSILFQCRNVRCGSVSLMLSKAIFRK